MSIGTVTWKEPVVLLLLGTSGVGKTSVLEYLQSHHSFESSPKYTTRKLRNNVSDERDFIFCHTIKDFPKDDILIFQSYGYAFGIQIERIKSSITRGRNHVLAIGDTETAITLKSIFPHQTKVIQLYCEYNILKTRIVFSTDVERASRWKTIDKEVQGVYSWAGVVDDILDCTMQFDITKIHVDKLIDKIR